MSKLKFYQPGYSIIHPLSSIDNELWKYAVQIHKNQNGTHFDFRLFRPQEKVAYSWVTKKVPFFKTHEKLAAYRTYDHTYNDMVYEGILKTARGTGTIKMLAYGTAKVLEIDKTAGVTFTLDLNHKNYNLNSIQGKKYLLREV